MIIGDGLNVIATGVKGYIEIPYDMTIESVRLYASQSGSIVIDLWEDTYDNFPPTDADSFTSSTPPTITSSTKGYVTDFTGWSLFLAKGNIIGINVDSCTDIKQVTLAIAGKRCASS